MNPPKFSVWYRLHDFIYVTKWTVIFWENFGKNCHQIVASRDKWLEFYKMHLALTREK